MLHFHSFTSRLGIARGTLKEKQKAINTNITVG
jgi:hypothetical protein